MRAALAILAGILVAFAVQAGVDIVASTFYPYAITDMWDRNQYSEAYAARPTGALLLSVLGYFLAGLAGGYVAKLISRSVPACWVPPGVMAVTAIVLAFAFPLPAWAWIALFAAPLFGGLIANHLVTERASVEIPPPAARDPEADASV
jgi:hypothetical protein